MPAALRWHPVRRVLTDASSAILLHKAGLFGVVADAYRVVMAPSVAGEVTAAGRLGADTFAGMMACADIAVAAPPVIDAPPQLPSGLHDGERDTLPLTAGRRRIR